MKSSLGRPPILPDRVRRIDGSFAFLPHRLLRDGFLTSLSPDERGLYLFLVLAADRTGISFYSYDKICALLEIDPDAYLHARNGLLAKDLIAFDGTRFQVLSLPAVPRWTAEAAPSRDPELVDHATIHGLTRRSLRSSQR
ncbi:MAG: hypothetical protein IT374_19180 [Polyangiaceae bacterium]|nr:hypothetical protein [Polyangiaceae bacterium]